MHSVEEIFNNKVRLLSNIELDEVLSTAAEVISEVCQPQALAILMWDPDLEAFADRFLFGPRKKDFAKFAEGYEEEDPSDKRIFELDLDDLGVNLPKELEPVLCYRIAKDRDLCACVLIAGAAEEDEQELLEDLGHYPFLTALSNAWEYRELQRENTRLRNQYEEMEQRTSNLEDQTVKLIHDITAKDSIRTKQVERDRLIYWISNAVRSSVHIQQVLDITVKNVGTTLGVSRCLLLRSVDTADQLNVIEFTQEFAPSVKHLFFSDAGLQFTSTALSKTSPHDLTDPSLDSQGAYNREFLQQLGIRSGLIVPMVMRETVLGVLFLQDCLEPRNWTIDDVSMIGSLADNLAVAIENAELHQERERQAVTDGLTGVANRRSFNDTFGREFERARRYSEPLSLVVIDLDFLKKINDTFGHQAGDEAIKAIGRLLKQSSRAVDLPARYGGEEFCLLLPNTEIDMAEQLAERLRRLIAEVEVEGPGHISASIGVASYPLHADDPDILFQCADEALYQAKQSGRNQVKVATPKTAAAPNSQPTNDAANKVVDGNSEAQAGDQSKILDIR
jgi:diguanylate cyclase (GGDEF)-like protein